MKEVPTKCIVCGKSTMLPEGGWGFCSLKCSFQYRLHMMEEKACMICGKKLEDEFNVEAGSCAGCIENMLIGPMSKKRRPHIVDKLGKVLTKTDRKFGEAMKNKQCANCGKKTDGERAFCIDCHMEAKRFWKGEGARGGI